VGRVVYSLPRNLPIIQLFFGPFNRGLFISERSEEFAIGDATGRAYCPIVTGSINSVTIRLVQILSRVPLSAVTFRGLNNPNGGASAIGVVDSGLHGGFPSDPLRIPHQPSPCNHLPCQFTNCHNNKNYTKNKIKNYKNTQETVLYCYGKHYRIDPYSIHLLMSSPIVYTKNN
jgi:hypothetical protein